MKKGIIFIIALLLNVGIFAQAPNKMSYQTVIRNASGIPVNGLVGIRISIYQNAIGGTPVYVETHITTTNINGLASLEIGNGTIVLGTIAGIDWSTGPYFIKTEADPSGGANYTISGSHMPYMQAMVVGPKMAIIYIIRMQAMLALAPIHLSKS